MLQIEIIGRARRVRLVICGLRGGMRSTGILTAANLLHRLELLRLDGA